MRFRHTVALPLVGWYLMFALAFAAVPSSSLAGSESKVTTYTNRTFGFSFQYPSDWTLTEGDQVKLSWGYLGPVGNSLKGGVTVAALQVPGDLYRGADFGGAFLKVTVDTGITLLECYRSSFYDWEAVKPDEYPTVWIGENQFSEDEEFNGGLGHQTIAQYYHIFRNGSCYEFQLGLSTAGYGAAENLRKVDDDDVLERLKAIVATSKFYTKTIALPPTQAKAK